MKSLAIVATLAVFAAAPAFAFTDITGQSATAVFGSSALGTINNQFVSPQVVGAGVEFTGDFTDVFGQNWVLGLDLFGTGFSVTITETTRGDEGNVLSGSALNISITGLSGLAPVFFDSYTCLPAGGFGCGAFGPGPSINSLTSNATSVYLDLGTIRASETYTFAFVPEPATWAMLIVGFGFVGSALRRRRALLA